MKGQTVSCLYHLYHLYRSLMSSHGYLFWINLPLHLDSTGNPLDSKILERGNTVVSILDMPWHILEAIHQQETYGQVLFSRFFRWLQEGEKITMGFPQFYLFYFYFGGDIQVTPWKSNSSHAKWPDVTRQDWSPAQVFQFLFEDSKKGGITFNGDTSRSVSNDVTTCRFHFPAFTGQK